jgi:hypothetical protein
VKGAPYLLLVVPVEGRVRALLVSDSFEDEERLAVDVAGRRLVDELVEALRELADALSEGTSC